MPAILVWVPATPTQSACLCCSSSDWRQRHPQLHPPAGQQLQGRTVGYERQDRPHVGGTDRTWHTAATYDSTDAAGAQPTDATTSGYDWVRVPTTRTSTLPGGLRWPRTRTSASIVLRHGPETRTTTRPTTDPTTRTPTHVRRCQR